MTTPSPGVSPSAGPSGSGGADATAIINAFAQSMGTGSTGSKPTIAWQDYGPISRLPSDYEHGTYRQDPTTAPRLAVTKSVTDMSNEYYNWDQTKKDGFRSKLALIDKGALTAPDDVIAKAWGDYVQQSANYYAAGQTISPLDIMARDIAVKSGPGAAPSTKTQQTSDTTLTSRADANAIFQSAAQSLLGRNATPDEQAKFASLLTRQEQANPTQAQITTTTDAEGNATNSSRITSGGFNSQAAGELAKQVAQESPDYGANAANNYMKVLLGLVGVK